MVSSIVRQLFWLDLHTQEDFNILLQRQCIRNLKAIVEAAGSCLENIVEVNVFLADWDDFGKVNEVYVEWFGERAPARTYVLSLISPNPDLIHFLYPNVLGLRLLIQVCEQLRCSQNTPEKH